MSCPDWRALRPRDEAGEGSAAWLEALEHLDRCSACRERAIEAEPTLLFRRPPAIEVGRDEIEAMKLAVRQQRRAEEIEQPRRDRAAAGGWLRAAAVAALIAAAGLIQGGPGLLRPSAVPAAAVDTAAVDTAALAKPALEPSTGERPVEAATTPAAELAQLDFSHLALVEDVETSVGNVIQVVHDDLAVVVVELSESLDV